MAKRAVVAKVLFVCTVGEWRKNVYGCSWIDWEGKVSTEEGRKCDDDDDVLLKTEKSFASRSLSWWDWFSLACFFFSVEWLGQNCKVTPGLRKTPKNELAHTLEGDGCQIFSARPYKSHCSLYRKSTAEHFYCLKSLSKMHFGKETESL